MPFGPGKYDAECTAVMERTHAKGAIVIIFDGDLGHGFSVQADPITTLALPDTLEDVARAIRASFMEGQL